MEEVLRMMAVRPPDTADEAAPRIELLDPNDPDTVDALRGGGTSDKEPPDLGDLKARLEKIPKWLSDPANDGADGGQVAAKVTEIVGGAEVVAGEDWTAAKAALDEALLDGKFLRGKNRERLASHARLRRAMAVADTALSAAPPGAIDGFRTLVEAPFVVATPTPPKRDEKRQSDEFQKRKEQAFEEARNAIATYEGLNEAIGYFEVMPAAFLKLKEAEGEEVSPAPSSRSPVGVRRARSRFSGWLFPRPDHSADQVPAKRVLAIDPTATENLSETARDALASSGIDIAGQDVDASLAELRRLKTRAQLDAHSILEPYTADEVSVSLAGGHFAVTVPISMESDFVHAYAMAPGNYHSIYLPGKEYLPPSEELVPAPSCSPIVPSGFGQLLVVRQQLKCYERTEISHVENVLEGETRSRDHRRSVTTEETFLLEQITESTEERHLETTERFELSSEAERVLKSDREAKGELSVSGKYGPTVEFEASAGVQVSSSKEKSIRVAQEFAQETTEKAINKITERLREQRTIKIVEEVEESNHHGFVNDTAGHIIGIYQWLNKVYEAQIFDYGLRLLFDIIVPEPAAFMISAFHASQKTQTPRLKEPLPFTKRPDELDEGNYYTYVERYGAKDVQAPPEPVATVSKSFVLSDRRDNWEDTRHAEGGEVMIPESYEAVYGYMTATMSGSADESGVDIHLDRTWYRFTFDKTVESTPMNNQRGSIPVAWKVYAVSVAAATVEIRCRRTAAALNQWRLETHEKIKTAYEVRLAEYHAEQDKLALEAKEELESGNPADNKRLAETELKRAAISIIANKRQLFDLIDVDFHDIPFVDLSARLDADPIIRFLEQAFEWENMNYLYYPYFWGRKEPHWKQKILFESTDSTFAKFVRAGAARVQLAVRPGFENAVDHFLKTCEPWSGGDLPTISDPLYLPFADELATQLGRPGDEVPVGEPWDVRVPTNLVILRPDSTLPKWQKVGEDWVEVEAGDGANGENGGGDGNGGNGGGGNGNDGDNRPN